MIKQLYQKKPTIASKSTKINTINIQLPTQPAFKHKSQSNKTQLKPLITNHNSTNPQQRQTSQRQHITPTE